MYTYRAYGLEIASELPLPELRPASLSEVPDVVVRLGSLDHRAAATEVADEGHREFKVGEAFFQWGVVGRILVRDGREIVIDPNDEVEAALLRAPLLGPVIAALLQQRGVLTLHASAVVIDGQVVAFLGRKGWGKSTTAAALQARGHTLIGDDVLAIRHDRRQPVALVGFPQLKLFPDSVAAVGEDPDSVPRMHSLVSKRNYMVGAPPPPLDAYPIGALYILGVGEETRVHALTKRRAFEEVVRHTYSHEHILLSEARHVASCAALLRAVPVRRLVRRADLGDLATVVRVIEGDVSSERKRSQPVDGVVLDAGEANGNA